MKSGYFECAAERKSLALNLLTSYNHSKGMHERHRVQRGTGLQTATLALRNKGDETIKSCNRVGRSQDRPDVY